MRYLTDDHMTDKSHMVPFSAFPLVSGTSGHARRTPVFPVSPGHPPQGTLNLLAGAGFGRGVWVWGGERGAWLWVTYGGWLWRL